jgi:hypothetical protein
VKIAVQLHYWVLNLLACFATITSIFETEKVFMVPYTHKKKHPNSTPLLDDIYPFQLSLWLP